MPTKAPTDFIQYMTAAYYFTRTINYSDEFIDTNYCKQNKQKDDFELYRNKRPLLQSIRHFADENTNWLW